MIKLRRLLTHMSERRDMDDRQLWQSQNFLRSPEFVSSLIDKTSIDPADTVVEIGPGKGVITRQLAERAKKVIGVEYDSDLAQKLKLSLSSKTNIEIVEADFLRWDLPRYPYKVFANIPFNMTADMVNKLLVSSNPPESTYLIMQDSAAERFIGAPVGPNSQISILLQPFYDMGVVTRIDRRQFEPVPSVNAVLARFDRRNEPLVDPKLGQQYRDFVIYGYNQWQPTILDAFKKVFSGKQTNIISKRFGVAGLKPLELTVEQWVGLFDSFMEHVPEDKKVIVRGAENRLRSKQKGMKKQHRTRKR